jgi:hypothetical protein
MSAFRSIAPGDSTVFTTRVVGQGPTILSGFTPAGVTFGRLTWHIELCCHDTHELDFTFSFTGVDIGAAGALVTIGNVGNTEIFVGTDYIV